MSEVFIRRDGESIVLTPRPTDWSGFFAGGLKASADFMAESEPMPIQERRFEDGACMRDDGAQPARFRKPPPPSR